MKLTGKNNYLSYVCLQNSTWHIWNENDLGNGLNVEILPQILPSSLWESTIHNINNLNERCV